MQSTCRVNGAATLTAFKFFQGAGRYLAALFNFGKATFLAFVNRQDNCNMASAAL